MLAERNYDREVGTTYNRALLFTEMRDFMFSQLLVILHPLWVIENNIFAFPLGMINSFPRPGPHPDHHFDFRAFCGYDACLDSLPPKLPRRRFQCRDSFEHVGPRFLP